MQLYSYIMLQDIVILIFLADGYSTAENLG